MTGNPWRSPKLTRKKDQTFCKPIQTKLYMDIMGCSIRPDIPYSQSTPSSPSPPNSHSLSIILERMKSWSSVSQESPWIPQVSECYWAILANTCLQCRGESGAAPMDWQTGVTVLLWRMCSSYGEIPLLRLQKCQGNLRFKRNNAVFFLVVEK